jgi:hypothetical protein
MERNSIFKVYMPTSLYILVVSILICTISTLSACGGSDPANDSQSESAISSGSESGQQSSSAIMYAVTPSVDGVGGSISPDSIVSVRSSTAITFTVVPQSGYTISAVTEIGRASCRERVFQPV